MDSFGGLKQFVFGPCREVQHHRGKGQTIGLFQFSYQSLIDGNLTGIHALIVGDMSKVMAPNSALSRFKGLSADSTYTVAFLTAWYLRDVHDLASYHMYAIVNMACRSFFYIMSHCRILP